MYHISFDGYWLEKNKKGVPSKSGVYIVYRCKYDIDTNTVNLQEIIYIGQSTDINERIVNHDHIELFKDTLLDGETLCYACAQIDETDLDVVEGALIIAQKPRLNMVRNTSIDYSDKRFVVSGRCSLLKYTDFTITFKAE